MNLCRLDIIIAHKPWRQGKYGPLIQEAIESTLNHLKIKELKEVCIKLTSDADIQKLNATYRGKDKPTNVLSFPLSPSPAVPHALGDIVLAFETIQAEAITHRKKFEDHLTHLVVHGLLHLLGYDHVKDADTIIMESLEKQILQSLGIKDPYEIDE